MTTTNGTAASWIDLTAKVGAIVAAGLYGTGFTIISLYQARYGIFAFDVFRPRVFAAGFVFVGLVALSTLTAYQLFKFGWWAGSTGTTPRDRVREMIADAPLFFGGCQLIALNLGISLGEMLPPTGTVMGLYYLVGLVCFIGVIVARIILRKRPNWNATASAVLTMGMLLAVFRPTITNGELTFAPTPTDWLTVWLFGTGLFAAELHERLRGENRLQSEWLFPVVWMLIVLSSYSAVVYPYVKTAYGGGVPTDITIYFRDHGALGGQGQSLETRLIDENERGLYITTSAGRAYFIPRDQIAYVKFERRTDPKNTSP